MARRVESLVFLIICCAGLWPQAVRAQAAPDLIVGDIPAVVRLGHSGDITVYGVASTACNVGDAPADWHNATSQHPVTVQNLYRLKDGRFEQIGQSWAVHNIFALQESLCSECAASGTFELLGVGCSTPNTAGFNGFQMILGPRSQINAATGQFPYPFSAPPPTPISGRRLQVHDAELLPALNAGAEYFTEVQYVAADDAGAGHGANNASYRRVTVSQGRAGILLIDVADLTQQRKPAIRAWADQDSAVQLTPVSLPGDGQFWVASKATDLGGGLWHYEYAIQNLSSDRSAGSLNVG
ncbi:MAG TPA: hypothetical protein VGM03_05060, partial [Phycisphaerae bacterium]